MSEPINTQDLDAMAEQYQLMTSEEKSSQLAEAKELLEEKTKKLKELELAYRLLDTEIKAIDEGIQTEINEIRKIWMPLISGATESRLVLDNGLTLSMKQVLNISVEDKEKAIEWFQTHGFDGVLKWEIHHSTLKSIATEQYNDKENPTEIPGLKYSTFPVVKVE